MNTTTFNEGLLVPNDLVILESDGVTMTQLIPASILTSPIFVWDDFEDDKLVSLPDNDDVIRRIQSEPNLLPFKTMRLYVRANLSDSADGTKGFKVWMHHDGGTLQMRIVMQGPLKIDVVWGIFTEPQGENLGLFFRSEGKIINVQDLQPQYAKAVQDQALAIFTSVCWFIREVTSPANFTASVSPSKQGKSVEWVKSRSHYVILHRGHPANRKEVGHGTNIKDCAKAIVRQAHSRRAHARVLRSPRFKNKVGQIIYVKASWVGPEEWKQSGSIYRVIQTPTKP